MLSWLPGLEGEMQTFSLQAVLLASHGAQTVGSCKEWGANKLKTWLLILLTPLLVSSWVRLSVF